MRALVLAGGKATRLRPLTLNTPKAMTPVLGRPFLEHLLAWLARHEVRDVTLLLGHLPDPIRAHFGDGSAFGVRLDYLAEEEPLGSGGAIKQLEQELTEPFFAINGDIFTDLDLSAMAAAHRESGAALSIALTPVEDPSPYGVVELAGDGRIRRFVEKPSREEAPSNLINAGVWLFDPEAVRRIPAGRFSMVEQELFPELAAAGRLYGHPADGYWIDAGTPARYLQLQRDLLGGVARPALPLVERVGWPGLAVGDTAGSDAGPPRLAAGVVLEDAVVLGAGVRVGPRAVLRGPLTVGGGCVIGDGAVVADSLLWDGCAVGREARVSGSVLASGCHVGDGAVLQEAVLGEGVTVRPGARLRGAVADAGAVIG